MNKKKLLDIILSIVLLFLLVLVFLFRDELLMTPSYEYTTAAAAFYGQDGRVFVTDHGKSYISVIEKNNTMSKLLKGGREDRFYYAQGVTEGDDGTLYIADQAYVTQSDGSVTEEYRIVEYASGRYSVLYSSGDSIIHGVRFYNGQLYFLQDDSSGIAVYRMEEDGKAHAVRRTYIGDVPNDASYDFDTGVFVIATKRGAVRLWKDEQESWYTLQFDGEHLMPATVAASGGKVWFSELYSGRVCCLDESDPDVIETVYTEPDLKVAALSVSKDGRRALGADLISFYSFSEAVTSPDGEVLKSLKAGTGSPDVKSGADNEDGTFEHAYMGQVVYSAFYRTVILWIVLVLAVIILLWLLRFLPGTLMGLLHNESALRMSVVVVAVILVSGFLAWSLIDSNHKKEDEWDVSSMKLFADMVINNTDTDLLDNIRTETAYGGSSYVDLRSTLDLLMAEAQEQGREYYYVFYGKENGKICYLLNYYDTVMCGEPVGKLDSEYYHDVLEKRNAYALKTRDADGLWLYVLSPVVNEKDECVAVLEIGTDLSYGMSERKKQTIDVIINVFSSSAVMMMLIIEALFFMSFAEKRRTELKKDPTESNITGRIPLRTIILLTYMAVALQDPFITVLASRLYTGGLPITSEMASGLPLTLSLLMMALAGIVTGHIAEKIGTRKIFLIGIFIELAGFLVCAMTSNYYGLLCGNVLMGMGLGLINVICNTLAAMGGSMENTAQAFADVMAGILSGLTMGAGFASLLFPLGGSRLAYSVSACFMLPAIFIIRYSMDSATENEVNRRAHLEKTEDESSKIGFARFFFNLRVLGFFALILVPFMTSISYREYFFPLYASGNGFMEDRIGQIYLLCGLMVIYVGAHISSWVIKRFGTFWSIVFASLLMAGNMLLFVIKPGMVTVLLGVVILSVITSFAYTCQYTYFEQLPDCVMYGDGKSMGIYSLFENAGQTIGPMVYGALMALGYRRGIGVFCAVLFVFAVLYVALMRRQEGLFR